LIARHDRPQKPGFCGAKKEHAVAVELLCRILLALSKQHNRGLRHALDDQGAGHHGHAREVAKEEYLVSADVLHCHDCFPLFERQDPVQHQKREFLRQQGAQLVEPHGAVRACHDLGLSPEDSAGRRSTSEALIPSGPNELTIASSAAVLVACRVIPASPQRGSASRKLTVAGTTFSRSVRRLAATWNAPAAPSVSPTIDLIE